MKRYIAYFLISLGSMCFVPDIMATDQPLSPAELDTISATLPAGMLPADLPAGTTPTDIVKWLLNTLGSFLTTLIMYFLHRWFPKIFPTAKIKAYVGRPNSRFNNNT